MKGARIIVLAVALGAGGVAAMLAGRTDKGPVQPAKTVDGGEILVAKTNIPTGKTISPQDLEWQAWPETATSEAFIRKSKRPDAINKISGLIVRAPFVAGEPIRDAKVVDAKNAGYLAAILPKGMRAVSTRISPETGAGGFILPNDHVDVILTRKNGSRGAERSETILSNIRVLAIDQTVQEKDGQKVVVGKTATLELSPRAVEELTLAQQMGTLSLALRSVSDTQRDEKNDEKEPNANVDIVRFGVKKGT